MLIILKTWINQANLSRIQLELVKNLDLIITADTSLGHLSATLGKPTWIALPFVSDWRWFQDEKKSIWYDTVKLFRQKKIGNWGQVFDLIYKDLKKSCDLHYLMSTARIELAYLYSSK